MKMESSIHSDLGWRGIKQILLSLIALALVAGMASPATAGMIPRMKTGAAQAYPTPIYPQIARAMKLSGEVYLEVVVGPQGNVKEVRSGKGPFILSQAAREAVRQWKFAPALSDRVVVVAFNFTNP